MARPLTASQALLFSRLPFDPLRCPISRLEEWVVGNGDNVDTGVSDRAYFYLKMEQILQRDWEGSHVSGIHSSPPSIGDWVAGWERALGLEQSDGSTRVLLWGL
eukprot:g77884.t1